jgi:hypothetical protein
LNKVESKGRHEVLLLAVVLDREGERAEVVLAHVLPLEVDLDEGCKRQAAGACRMTRKSILLETKKEQENNVKKPP